MWCQKSSTINIPNLNAQTYDPISPIGSASYTITGFSIANNCPNQIISYGSSLSDGTRLPGFIVFTPSN